MLGIDELRACLIHQGKPNGPAEDWRRWCAGDQLGALRFYLCANVHIVATHKEDDREGYCFALMRLGDTWYLWRDSFGSCCGCDALDGQNGYEYIDRTLSSGNVEIFSTPEKARDFLRDKERTANYYLSGPWMRLAKDSEKFFGQLFSPEGLSVKGGSDERGQALY